MISINDFHNRAASYVMITGASSGIGAAFARRFAKEGYSLILIARRLERLQNLAAELRSDIKDNQDVVVISADLNKSGEVKRIFRETEDKNVFIFINNAGFGDCGCFLDTDEEKEMSMIDVNIRALHLAMKLALRKMREKDRGYILNVASSAGLFPAGPYMAAYYASKAYVVSLTRAVAFELKQRKSKIYLGALCPGPVDTEFNRVANVEFALKGISSKDCADYAVKQMKKRKMVIVPTFMMKVFVFFGRVFPPSVVVRIAAYQQRRKISWDDKL